MTHTFYIVFQKMNMKLPKSLRDKDPMLSSLPTVDSAMEYSNHEWTTEELDAVDTQVPCFSSTEFSCSISKNNATK